jgi:predicted peptidase
MQTTRVFISLLLFFFSLQSNAQQVAKRIPYRASPDGIIGFLEFRPADYGSQHHPLIIFLHGTDERGSGRPSEIQAVAANGIPRLCAAGASMKFTIKAQSGSFVVLSPQLSRQYGAWQPFYVKEMIDYAKKNLDIDTNRIYVTGLSLGGGGVWAAITSSAALTGSIAAAAPVCGTQDMTDSNFCRLIGAAHLPIWAFHSVDDRSVPVQSTEHAEVLGNICKLQPSIKISYYQAGGHARAWLNAYDTGHVQVLLKGAVKPPPGPNLYEWFLQHTLLDKTHTAAVKTSSSKKKKK